MSTVLKNMEDLDTLNENELEELYSWVDKIPLSRPKRNINRDFSDGVMIAEILKHFLPNIISVHNYPPANATRLKIGNWQLMNRKVFPKLHFQLTEDLIREICVGKVGLIERFLMHLRAKIERCMWDMQKEAGETQQKAVQQGKASMRLNQDNRRGKFNDRPEADQNLDNLQNSNEGKQKGKNVSPGRKPNAPAGPYKGVNASTNNARIKMMDEVVSRALFEEKEQECLAKEETIQILQAKVRRLEHLLHLKDIRIEDLQGRLETQRPTGFGKR